MFAPCMCNESLITNLVFSYCIHPQQDQLERYMTKYLVYSLLWSFSGDCKMNLRNTLGDFIRGVTTIPLPAQANMPIIDFEVRKLQHLDIPSIFQTFVVNL